jgi:hypothetical protein
MTIKPYGCSLSAKVGEVLVALVVVFSSCYSAVHAQGTSNAAKPVELNAPGKE